MMKFCIGYVIKQRLPRPDRPWRMPNLKVYQSEAVAKRYAYGSEILPVFVELEENS